MASWTSKITNQKNTQEQNRKHHHDQLDNITNNQSSVPGAQLQPTTAAQKTSFLDLFAEIRNNIYEFVFEDVEKELVLPLQGLRRQIEPCGDPRCCPKSMIPPGPKVSKQSLSLLETCRQVHKEALGYVHSRVHADLSIDW
jgi:hypothetical protein